MREPSASRSHRSLHIFRIHKDCCILEIQNWSITDKITWVNLREDCKERILDSTVYTTSNAHDGTLYVLLHKLSDNVTTFTCEIHIRDVDGKVSVMKSGEFSTKGKI